MDTVGIGVPKPRDDVSDWDIRVHYLKMGLIVGAPAILAFGLAVIKWAL